LYDILNPNKAPLIVEGVVQAPEKRQRSEDEEEDDDFSRHSSTENVRAESVRPGEEEQIVIARDVDLTPLLTAEDGEEEVKCVMIRAQVSNNIQDFSEPSPELLLCHKFEPLTMNPICGTFKGQREVTVTGTGLFPSTHMEFEAVHTLVVNSALGEDGKVELEVAMPVRCTDWTELTYTIPSIEEIFATDPTVKMPGQNVFESEVHFRLTTGEYIYTNAFKFLYYKSIAVDCAPQAVRRTGGTKLSISGAGVHFYSETAKLLIVDKASGSVQTIPFEEFEEMDGEGNGWTITCTTPALLPPAPVRAEGDEEFGEESGDYQAVEELGSGEAYLGLLLDGISQPHDSKLTPLQVFSKLSPRRESFPVLKAPATMGASLTLVVDGLVDSSVCKIRIRNAGGEFVETNGIIDIEESSISFNIPDTIPQLLPPGTSKNTSQYYVDICIDGSTFDRMEEAWLPIKI
jgi:hypothetical protein